MHIMLHIDDLSDHFPSNASENDPYEDFMDGLPADENIDMTESFEGDFYNYQERVYGPLDNKLDVPLGLAIIPAYIIVDGQVVHNRVQRGS